ICISYFYGRNIQDKVKAILFHKRCGLLRLVVASDLDPIFILPEYKISRFCSLMLQDWIYHSF
ncbi:MAG: hypothetical protein ACHQ1D_08880, partial [Nitrososphaerales archaeon]